MVFFLFFSFLSWVSTKLSACRTKFSALYHHLMYFVWDSKGGTNCTLFCPYWVVLTSHKDLDYGLFVVLSEAVF